MKNEISVLIKHSVVKILLNFELQTLVHYFFFELEVKIYILLININLLSDVIIVNSLIIFFTFKIYVCESLIIKKRVQNSSGRSEPITLFAKSLCSPSSFIYLFTIFFRTRKALVAHWVFIELRAVIYADAVFTKDFYLTLQTVISPEIVGGS